MMGTPAVYLGNIVNKEHFRTFVYAMNGAKKLVESWDEYEKHMESGLWFSTQEDAIKRVPVERKRREKKVVEEVIKDDFLPNMEA